MTSLVGAPTHRRAEPAARTARVAGTARWCLRVLAWTFTLSCLGALAVGVVVPRLAGATPYTILTSSMVPHYPPGTLVVDKPVGADGLSIGDVATYQLESGKPTVVTHRVVAINTTVTGKRTYTFQGDANDVADVNPVRPVQVRGRLWYAVPYLGRVNAALTGSQRERGVYVVAGVLALYAGAMFVGAARDRRRRSAS